MCIYCLNFYFSFTSLFYTFRISLIHFQTSRVARTRACVTQSEPGWLPAGITRVHEPRHYISDSIAISMRSGLLGSTHWPTAIIHSDPRIMDWSRRPCTWKTGTCPFRLSPHRFSSWYLIRVQVISSRIKRFVPSTPWRPSRAPISRRDH